MGWSAPQKPSAPIVYPVYRGFYFLPALEADGISAQELAGVTFYAYKSSDGQAWESPIAVEADSTKRFSGKQLELHEQLEYKYTCVYRFTDGTTSPESEEIKAGAPQLIPTPSLNLDSLGEAEIDPPSTGTLFGGQIINSEYTSNAADEQAGFKFTPSLVPPRTTSTLTLTGGYGVSTAPGAAKYAVQALARGVFLNSLTSTSSTYTITLDPLATPGTYEPETSNYQTFRGALKTYTDLGITFFETATPAAPINLISTDTYPTAAEFWNETLEGLPDFDTTTTPIQSYPQNYSPLLGLIKVDLDRFTGVTRRTNGVVAADIAGSKIYRKLTAPEFYAPTDETEPWISLDDTGADTNYSGILAAPTVTSITTSTSGGSLPAATQYNYWVVSVNSYGEWAASSRASITTGAGSSNRVFVNFSGVENATEYWIYRTTGAGSTTLPTSGTNYANRIVVGTYDVDGTSRQYINTGAALSTNPRGLGYPVFTLPLTDIDTIPNIGTLRVDGIEQITYTGKTVTRSYATPSISYTALSSVIRGANSTTPILGTGNALESLYPIGSLLPTRFTVADDATSVSTVIEVTPDELKNDADSGLIPSSGTLRIDEEELTYTGIQRGALTVRGTTGGVFYDIDSEVAIPNYLADWGYGESYLYSTQGIVGLAPLTALDSTGSPVYANVLIPSEIVINDLLTGMINWEQSARTLQGGLVSGQLDPYTDTVLVGVSVGPIVPAGRTVVATASVPLMVESDETQPIWVGLSIKDTSIRKGFASESSSLLDSDTLYTGFSTKDVAPAPSTTSSSTTSIQPLSLQPSATWTNQTNQDIEVRFELFYFTLGSSYRIPPKNGFGASVSYQVF